MVRRPTTRLRVVESRNIFLAETPDVEGYHRSEVLGDVGRALVSVRTQPLLGKWHKGGTNNLNINSYNALRANYKKNKVRFNNLLGGAFNVQRPDDTLRHYRGNDMIRYYGDFGWMRS